MRVVFFFFNQNEKLVENATDRVAESVKLTISQYWA